MIQFKEPDIFYGEDPKLGEHTGWSCRSVATEKELDACVEIQQKIWLESWKED